VLLALVAQSEKARPIAVTAAWGFDIAAFLNLYEVGIAKASPLSNWPPPLLPDTQTFPESGGSTPTPEKSGGEESQNSKLPAKAV
jgi:hypothetical protein